MTFQEIKAQSRIGLHREMAALSHYYAPSAPIGAAPRVVPIRVHREDRRMGDVQGTNLRYAQIADVRLMAVWLIEDFNTAERGGVFVLGVNEAYVVETVEIADGVTRSATVTRARPDQFAGRVAP